MDTNNTNGLFVLSASPHVKHSNNTRRIMLDVIIALMPAFIWSVVMFGWKALMLTAISVISCVGFEYGYQKLMKKPVTIGDLSAVVTGIILAFNVPSSAAWWIMPIGAFFAIVIVKQLFGGIGKNVVNPAIAARIFMFLASAADLLCRAYYRCGILRNRARLSEDRSYSRKLLRSRYVPGYLPRKPR